MSGVTRIDLRRATPADAPAIRDVHLAAIEGIEPEQYTQDQLAAWAHDRDPADYPIEAGDTYMLVAESTDGIVGFGWMKPEADPYFEADVEAEITAIYVRPDAAGHGIGSRLLDELESQGRRQGATTVGVWSSKNAVPFYAAHGYARVAKRRVELADGVGLAVEELVKRLD